MVEVVLETKLPNLKLHGRGKVRDIYDLGNTLLMIASDRISAFDCILPNGIPHKGAVLNGLSVYWFNRTRKIVKNHLITADVDEYPPELEAHKSLLEGRSMLVRKTRPIGIECVVRGYLAGSGWKDYTKTGGICGIKLPKGMQESEKLPEPVFTPATKAESGHDINITEEDAASLVGGETVAKVKDHALRIYEKASGEVLKKGIIISDTKFEFGFFGDEIILIDEALTPDSSRFWPADDYEPGQPQKSFDKQYVRDYLETLDWDKTPPAPKLPPKVVEETSRKYLEAYERITGKSLI